MGREVKTIQLKDASASTHMGYLVDLHSVKLDDVAGDEGGSGSWIQAMPLGTYDHPIHGQIEITPERCQRFADNVNNNVRDTELDIDYDHKADTSEAAGWVKKAEARLDGLWLFVEWTKSATLKIRERAYKYFSPEFVDSWTHPKTGVTFQDVLFGGGITNRPFLKDILPINLSEFTDGTVKLSGGNGMDEEQRKLFAKLLGLPEDATVEMILGAAQIKLGPNASNGGETDSNGNPPTDAGNGGNNSAGGNGDQQIPDGYELDPATGQLRKKKQSAPVAASEGGPSEEVVRLAEQSSDPAVRALAEFVKQQAKTLETTSAALKLSETNTRLAGLRSTKYALPPAVTERVRSVLMLSEKKVGDEVYGILQDVLKSGLVELGERGSSKPEGNGDAIKAFGDAVDKLVKNSNLTYADAVERVSAEQPQLFEEYRQASFAFREV